MSKYLIIPLGIIVMGLLYFFGMMYGFSQTKETVEIRTIYQPQYIDRYVTQTQYVEKLIEQPTRTVAIFEQSEPKIIEVQTYKQLREFESLETLQNWLNLNGGINYVASIDGTVTFGEFDSNNDCDDFARRLQAKAYNDGYDISIQIVDSDGYLMGHKVTEGGLAHAGNITFIGNKIYYLDVIPEKVICIGELD